MNETLVKICQYTGCDRKHLAKGYCNFHYYRERQGKPMNAKPRKHFSVDGSEVRDKHGRILISYPCQGCGKERTVLRSLEGEYPLCMACSAKNRDAKYISEHGRGRNWKGSKYFSGRIIYGWKQKAGERNLAWEITDDELDMLWDKQQGLCAFTGLVMSFDAGNPKKVSLDRINSNRGYKVDNVQFTCAYVNKAKQNRTDAEFIDMCRVIAKYRKS